MTEPKPHSTHDAPDALEKVLAALQELTDGRRKAEQTKSPQSQGFVLDPLALVPFEEDSDKAQQSMLRDIDAILGRLEYRIAAEQVAIDALLNRLAKSAG